MIKLTDARLYAGEEFSFEVEEEKRIGTMRVYFDNGRQLCNAWHPSSNMKDIIKKFGERLQITEIQEVVNDIIFNKLNTFQKVIDVCGGYGYEYETNRFTEYGQCNYWVRLIPVKGEYNYYIKAYVKEDI